MAEEGLVLVVDDDPALLTVLTGILKAAGIACLSTDRAEGALQALNTKDIDVVISDVKMPGMNGLQLLESIMKIDPSMQVIIMTAHEIGRASCRERVYVLV